MDEYLTQEQGYRPNTFAQETAKANRVKLYETAKLAPVGECVKCPGCVKPFTKKTKSQGFCSNKGAINCKDFYHNAVKPERQSRKWR